MQKGQRQKARGKRQETKAKGKRQRDKCKRQETNARGKRHMQEAKDKCMRWMQGVDAGGVQVDPQGWLRAPYSPGPNSQAK